MHFNMLRNLSFFLNKELMCLVFNDLGLSSLFNLMEFESFFFNLKLHIALETYGVL